MTGCLINGNARRLAANEPPAAAKGRKAFARGKDNVEMAVEFVSRKGEIKLLKGWVKEGDDFTRQMRSIFRQNGMELPLIYDERFGFGFGAVWFGEWGRAVDSFQYYINGKLPVMGTAGSYVGLNAGNLILSMGMKVTFREEEPQCPLGNMNLNTKGIKVREWGEFDPLTNTISWEKAVFSGEGFASRERNAAWGGLVAGEMRPAEPARLFFRELAKERRQDGVEGDFIAEGAKVPPAVDVAGSLSERWYASHSAPLASHPRPKVISGIHDGVPARKDFGEPGAAVQRMRAGGGATQGIRLPDAPAGFAGPSPVLVADARPAAAPAHYVPDVYRQHQDLVWERRPAEPGLPEGERIGAAAPKSGIQQKAPERLAEGPMPASYGRKEERADCSRKTGTSEEKPAAGREHFTHAGGTSQREARDAPSTSDSGNRAEGVPRPPIFRGRSGVTEELRRQEEGRKKKVEEERDKKRRAVPAGRKIPGGEAAVEERRQKRKGRKQKAALPEPRLARRNRNFSVAGPMVAGRAGENAGKKRVRMPSEKRKRKAGRKGILLDEEARKANRRKERVGEKRRGKDAVEYLAAKKARRPKKRKRWAPISKR